MRTITIYSTSGQDGKTILTDATTWGALKETLSQKQIQHEKMKAVIGENRNTLEAANAELPAGDFTLFLMPVRVKSGAYDPSVMSYKELRIAIKETIEQNGEEANKHFNKDKNYTNKSTDEMRSLLSNWLKKASKAIRAEKPAEEAIKSTTVADVVESVKQAKTEEKQENEGQPDQKQIILTKVGEIRKSLALMISDIDEFMLKHTMTEQTTINISDEKKQDLKSKAKDIAREFGDVQQF